MKNKYAQALGKMGGKARNLKLTDKEKADIARKGAIQRWENWKKKNLEGKKV